MTKRTKYILCITLCVVVAIIVGACLILRPKRTPVNANLQAVILDDHGTEIGTTNIVLSGYKVDYISQKSCLDIEISPFDGLSSIEPILEVGSYMPGPILYDSSIPFNYVIYSADQGDISRELIICFSPNFEHWLICSRPSFYSADTVYYLGSTSATDSVTELKDYFKSIITEE